MIFISIQDYNSQQVYMQKFQPLSKSLPMETEYRHFYLFKGNWSELFTELTDTLEPGSGRQFNVWEPVDKTKNHCLVIVYGKPLEEFYCYLHGIWKTDENTFHQFFLNHLDRFIIHGTDLLITRGQDHSLCEKR